MSIDWKDFSVATDLEALVATCEAILMRLTHNSQCGVSSENFLSPGGITYTLSFARRRWSDPDACVASNASMWLAESVLVSGSLPANGKLDDLRFLALCDWSCRSSVAVISHSVTSSDFFGEITATQATSLLSALHLALTHVGLGGEVPAIVQVSCSNSFFSLNQVESFLSIPINCIL